jgi:hypothetical protein
MGHQVDKILPELQNSVLQQQVAQYLASLRALAAAESHSHEKANRELDDRKKKK